MYLQHNNQNINVNMSYMFYNCMNLIEISIIGRYEYNNYYIKPSDFNSMFYNCVSLISVHFDYFNVEYIQDMKYMFYNCINFKYLYKNYFQMNSIKATKRSMKGMFENCEKLASLDLTNDFFTKNVVNMWAMFKGCTKLANLNLKNSNNFDTSQVTDMESMFEGCSTLSSLDISTFITTKVQYMNKMFYNCNKLEFLIFPSINANSLGTMHQMFYNCQSLKYLNLFSLSEKDQSISEIFEGASTSFKLCIEDALKIPNIFKEFFEMNLTSRDCEASCYGRKRVSIYLRRTGEYHHRKH